MIDYAKKMTAKKSCKCDEYKSFGHLLFFLFDSSFSIVKKSIGHGGFFSPVNLRIHYEQ